MCQIVIRSSFYADLCNTPFRRKCNSQITSYKVDVCHSTADLGVVANFVGVDNAVRGFPWICQTYT